MSIDTFKLIIAVLVLLGGIAGYYYLANEAAYVRAGVLMGAAVAAVLVAMLSTPGRAAWEFAKGSRVELRKVVWPSNKETVQVTLVVFLVVLLIAAFLWLVDLGLQKLVLVLTG